MKKFKERLKELRLNKELSQKKLAQEVGLSERTISHYECGISEPNLDLLIRLADYFDITTDYLLGIDT